jgi:hypothetical protein
VYLLPWGCVGLSWSKLAVLAGGEFHGLADTARAGDMGNFSAELGVVVVATEGFLESCSTSHVNSQVMVPADNLG